MLQVCDELGFKVSAQDVELLTERLAELARGAGKVPGRFAGSDVATFGRPPGDRLAGTVLLRLPGPLGSGVLACSTGLSACSGRHAMAPRPRRRATCSM